MDDKNVMKPKALYSYLTRLMYNRRSNFNPLWLDLVVGGMEDEEEPTWRSLFCANIPIKDL